MLIAGSMLLETVKPRGDEMGLSIPADSAGLIRRSCILPAGLLMLRILAMWLMLMGGAPLLGSATLPQCPARARVLTKLATGLVSCAELWLWAAATCMGYMVRLTLDLKCDIKYHAAHLLSESLGNGSYSSGRCSTW